MTSKSLVKYEPWTDDMVKEAAAEVDELTAGEFAKIPVGRSTWRVLPSTVRGVPPIVHVMEHFIKPPGGAKAIRFVCPRHMAKRACPACRRASELRASGHPADYDEAGQFMARLRAYCNAVQREHQDRGPQLLAVGKGLYEDFRGIRDEHGDYTHPVEGFDIVIKREGSKMEDTKYKAREARDDSPLHEDPTVVAQWLEMTKDLRQYTRVPSEEELEDMGISTGARRGRGRSDDDDEQPPTPARGGARRRQEPAEAAEADEPPPRRQAPARRAEPEERTVEDDMHGEPLEGELDDDGFSA